MRAWALFPMRGGQSARRGLGRRMAVASAVVACLMVITFTLLYGAIGSLVDAARLTERSEAVMASSNRLERLIIDLETGQRGYVITGDTAFLQPWNNALAAYPAQVANFQNLADRAGGGQGARAREIARNTDFYVHDYSIPLVDRVRRDPSRRQTVQVTTDGRHRMETLRQGFDTFTDTQRSAELLGGRHSMDTVRRGTLTATGAALGSLLLILLFTGYLTRAIVGPVRRAATMARRLAGGDLTVRMPETSLTEIGTLEHAFNAMAGSLEARQARIRRVAGDQAALRRVATLVARAASPKVVFETVAGELGRLLGTDVIVISRFELDRMETVVGVWGTEGNPVPMVGSSWSLEGRSLEARILASGASARASDYGHATSGIGVWARTREINSGVGCPVVVEGRMWGVIIAFSAGAEAPEGTEERMMEFTELVGTALANAENQGKLTAARARLVSASDETRRRIERDLHDGAQQRLVSLGLELRAAEVAVPAGQEALREQLETTARGLTGVLEDLQEISRGLHPAILSRAGLEPALKALARRAGAPVELRLEGLRRLEERLEVALYYIISEAVTNAIKRANASLVTVEVRMRETSVWLAITDDGSGADLDGGAILISLKDRVESLAGTLEITSPLGGGTRRSVQLPIFPA